MPLELELLRQTLVEAMKRSRQTSYERGSPSPQSVPELSAARAEIATYLADNPHDSDGWRLLSLADESLLRYKAAIASLERAMRQRRNRSDVKRHAQLLLRLKEQQTPPLADSEIKELVNYLIAMGIDNQQRALGLTRTREWLRLHGLDRTEEVISWFEFNGLFADHEIIDRYRGLL